MRDVCSATNSKSNTVKIFFISTFSDWLPSDGSRLHCGTKANQFQCFFLCFVFVATYYIPAGFDTHTYIHLYILSLKRNQTKRAFFLRLHSLHFLMVSQTLVKELKHTIPFFTSGRPTSSLKTWPVVSFTTFSGLSRKVGLWKKSEIYDVLMVIYDFQST